MKTADGTGPLNPDRISGGVEAGSFTPGRKRALHRGAKRKDLWCIRQLSMEKSDPFTAYFRWMMRFVDLEREARNPRSLFNLLPKDDTWMGGPMVVPVKFEK
jgi:hypothetical protein